MLFSAHKGTVNEKESRHILSVDTDRKKDLWNTAIHNVPAPKVAIKAEISSIQAKGGKLHNFSRLLIILIIIFSNISKKAIILYQN